MPLTLVTGPANSGKAGHLLCGYRARLDEEPVLVVPRLEDVEHTRRELAEGGAVLGVRVVRFAGLFELIAARVDPALAAVPRATPLARELLVGEAVRRAALRTLGTSARRPGFGRAASRFIAELGATMVEPPRLRRALVTWAGEGPRRAYADDLADLYEAYAKALAQAGLADDELFARRALDALRRDPRGFGASPVYVYGFDDFTAPELDALEGLARRAGVDVTVSLPFERGRVAFRAAASAFAVLSELADEHVELPASTAHYAPDARAALALVERRLFEPSDGHASAGADEPTEPPAPISPGDAVALHLAGGERAEVELSAAEVLAALRSGTDPGEVAVVARDPTRYGGLFEEVYSAYGIPFALERSVALGHTALGRGLVALLRCAAGAGLAEDLVAYLRTPGLLRSPRPIDELESEIRRAGIETAEAAREAWEARRWPLAEIDRLRALAGGPGLLEELDRRLDRLFAGPYARRAHLLSAREAEDAAVLRAARAALADLATLTAAGVGPQLEPAALADLLAEVPVRIGDPPSPDRVRVASLEAVRARRFALVVVLGLQQGEFPRRPAPEPFLSDEVRREVSAASDLSLHVREDEVDRERLLFYACASRAERRLVVSARVTDEDGAPQPPSAFLDDLRELFAPGALDEGAARRTLADVTWRPEQAPTEREHERALAARAPRSAPALAGGLRTGVVLDALAARRDFSAGELEAFAGCGVRWLVEKLLRPDRLEPDPEALVRGRYAHEVLRLTLERLRERTGSSRVTPESLAQAVDALGEALEELDGEHAVSPRAARHRAARRRLERELRRHLRREAEAGGDYEPRHLELAFGLDSDAEGVPALELEPGGVRVRGRIDRVDMLGERALVRDYKAGAQVAGVASWEDAGDLQVALYMLALRDGLELDPVGGLYVSLAGKGSVRGVVRDDQAGAVAATVSRADVRERAELETVLASARKHAAEAAERLRRGDVRPCPERCTPGGGCRYPTICREERA